MPRSSAAATAWIAGTTFSWMTPTNRIRGSLRQSRNSRTSVAPTNGRHSRRNATSSADETLGVQQLEALTGLRLGCFRQLVCVLQQPRDFGFVVAAGAQLEDDRCGVVQGMHPVAGRLVHDVAIADEVDLQIVGLDRHQG